MNRWFVLLILGGLCYGAQAHLNHMQFAAIDESGHALHVRYRMAADMFLSNLDIEIKAGLLDAALKDQPIESMLAAYFSPHLRLIESGRETHFNQTRFTLEDKTGDWIADFFFTAPTGPFTLLCDAFLENNPRTQTLARIDWRGKRDVFHFKKGSERWSIAGPLAYSAAPRNVLPAREQFVNDLADGLRNYGFLLCGALLWALRPLNNDIVALLFAMCCALRPGDLQFSPGIFVATLAVMATAGALLRDAATLLWRKTDPCVR